MGIWLGTWGTWQDPNILKDDKLYLFVLLQTRIIMARALTPNPRCSFPFFDFYLWILDNDIITGR